MQKHLQTGNLAQVEAEKSQPVDEAVARTVSQRYDLAYMGCYAISYFAQERRRDEIGRADSKSLARHG